MTSLLSHDQNKQLPTTQWIHPVQVKTGELSLITDRLIIKYHMTIVRSKYTNYLYAQF